MQIGIKKIKNSNNKQNKTIIALVIGIIAVSIFIAVMIGRFVGRADFSEDTEDEEEILRKPVSKSILNEPSPNMIIYFGAVYLLGWIL